MPVKIGNSTLYLGDCREVMALLSTEAIVTDPPYGIKFGHARSRKNRVKGLAWGAGSESKDRDWKNIEGDDEDFDPAHLLQAGQVVIFGANHFADKLPASPSWLVWDKRDGSPSDDHSDCEMAWSNLGGPARIFRHLWRGVVRAGEDNCSNGAKLHPCQKPIELMRWIVAKTAGRVLDPYMGSGTTGVACADLSREFVGVEIDPGYFEIACKRIDAAYAQGRLFA